MRPVGLSAIIPLLRAQRYQPVDTNHWGLPLRAHGADRREGQAAVTARNGLTRGGGISPAGALVAGPLVADTHGSAEAPSPDVGEGLFSMSVHINY